jgi:hypothetical protein
LSTQHAIGPETHDNIPDGCDRGWKPRPSTELGESPAAPFLQESGLPVDEKKPAWIRDDARQQHATEQPTRHHETQRREPATALRGPRHDGCGHRRAIRDKPDQRERKSGYAGNDKRRPPPMREGDRRDQRSRDHGPDRLQRLMHRNHETTTFRWIPLGDEHHDRGDHAGFCDAQCDARRHELLEIASESTRDGRG